eukprot:TRINITY_DN36184_c0_g1_i2.p3 TRINITY_DN36184_c0_g1~~TRINITY_DN36184_c0_g1_i2.p3  ORF type:complete len:106 (+),score=5.08 TRINITY_DN36184_c0_g1_i2:60-377(+)
MIVSEFYFFFFFKQKTAYEIMPSLVGSEMCIRDSSRTVRIIRVILRLVVIKESADNSDLGIVHGCDIHGIEIVREDFGLFKGKIPGIPIPIMSNGNCESFILTGI